MQAIKAIETRYHGCRFRSRLEARWAVLFDHLGIRWEYEKEGFELRNGERYLPDFFLPEKNVWCEIKPGVAFGWQGVPVYLAGPISPVGELDWRELVKNVERVGPERCKGHGATLHGITDDSCEPDAHEIVARCLRQISECEELCAWIPDRNRYGTILEIGYAKALGKKIRVAIHEDAMIDYPGADGNGSVWNSCQGEFQSHELWFVETCADESRIAVSSVEEAVAWFSNHLTKEETTCATFSETHTVWMCHGVPGDEQRPIIYFVRGQPRWRGWPASITKDDAALDAAIRAARSARFEFGESG